MLAPAEAPQRKAEHPAEVRRRPAVKVALAKAPMLAPAEAPQRKAEHPAKVRRRRAVKVALAKQARKVVTKRMRAVEKRRAQELRVHYLLVPVSRMN